MFMLSRSAKTSLVAFFCLLVLSGCINRHHMREETAVRLAAPAFMLQREVPAAPFNMTVFERMHERNADAHIYIEGDGMNWISPSRPSLDPTPSNPVGLHLATRDKAPNVAYIARPCQFTKLLNEDKPCHAKYWTNARYAEEVVMAVGKTIDNIKRRYDIRGVHLIGFSGGGAVAAILAAQRDDVLSFRTVAGNLDHRTHSTYHEVSPLVGSLNAIDFAASLKDIPQHHYIGGQDEIVPPAILHSYLQALGATNCVSYSYVQEAEHAAGWVDKWPDLLKEPAVCQGMIDAVPFDPMVPGSLAKGLRRAKP